MNPSCSWKVNGYCHSVTSPPVFQPLSSTPQRSLRSNVWRKAGEGFANRKGLCTVLNMIYITRPTILKRLAVFQALSFLHWSRMWCVADYVPLTLCLNSGETRGGGRKSQSILGRKMLGDHVPSNTAFQQVVNVHLHTYVQRFYVYPIRFPQFIFYTLTRWIHRPQWRWGI